MLDETIIYHSLDQYHMSSDTEIDTELQKENVDFTEISSNKEPGVGDKVSVYWPEEEQVLLVSSIHQKLEDVSNSITMTVTRNFSIWQKKTGNLLLLPRKAHVL